jgi:hypothetical protein
MVVFDIPLGAIGGLDHWIFGGYDTMPMWASVSKALGVPALSAIGYGLLKWAEPNHIPEEE